MATLNFSFVGLKRAKSRECLMRHNILKRGINVSRSSLPPNIYRILLYQHKFWHGLICSGKPRNSLAIDVPLKAQTPFSFLPPSLLFNLCFNCIVYYSWIFSKNKHLCEYWFPGVAHLVLFL